MAAVPNDILLWVVLLAPGFIAVIVAVTLSALERDLPTYYLIFSSLVSSLIIDLIYLWTYDIRGNSVSDIFTEGSQFILQPEFNFKVAVEILGLSIFVGLLYAVGIIYDIPRVLRSYLWFMRDITGHKGQPWQSFLKNSGQIRIKTSDDEIYSGVPVRWNSDQRDKELVLLMPHRINKNSGEYEPIGGDQLLFTSDDIDRILQQKTREEIRPNTDNSSSLVPTDFLIMQFVLISIVVFNFGYIFFDDWFLPSLSIVILVGVSLSVSYLINRYTEVV